MTQGREASKAAWQWGGLIAATLAGAAIGWRVHAQPLDVERLHVQVSQLASFAAEARVIARQRGGPRLPETIARQHAAQLADAFGKAADKLAEADVEPALQPRRDAAESAARSAVAEVGHMADGRAPGSALGPAADALAHQAKQLEDAMH